MATTKGPTPLTEAQFVKELTGRINGADVKYAGEDGKRYTLPDLDERAVKAILGAVKAEVISCVTNGYKVTLNQFGRFEPVFVPEKKKGEMVRNPTTGETKPRAEGVPAGFKAKAFMSSTVKNLFPSTRTNAGKELMAKLDKSGAKAKPTKAAVKSKPVKATKSK